MSQEVSHADEGMEWKVGTEWRFLDERELVSNGQER